MYTLVKKKSIQTYKASIFRVGFEFCITKIDGWFIHVSHFSAIFFQGVNRSTEELAVVGGSIVDKPGTLVAVQLLAEGLAYLNASD